MARPLIAKPHRPLGPDHLPCSHAVLDIFSCHDLYFLKVVGWENKSENAPEASAADNKILISPDMKIITAGALKRLS